MRLCNEYGTVFKTVTDGAMVEHLKEAGWRVVEEPILEEVVTEKAAPVVVCKSRETLKYKDRYLSWYVQSGSVKQLRDVLSYLGVPIPAKAQKKELQKLLKSRIREWKNELKGEASDDSE